MQVLAVGNSRHDADLFAAALASLGVGLFTYGTFLFFAAALYALWRQPHPGDHRGGERAVGAAVMVIGGLAFEHDTAEVAALGLGHSAAYFLGTLVLGMVLRRRCGPRVLPACVPSPCSRRRRRSVVWPGWSRISCDPSGSLADILVLAAIGVVGLAMYLLLLRMLPKRGDRLEQAFEPIDPDLAVEP